MESDAVSIREGASSMSASLAEGGSNAHAEAGSHYRLRSELYRACLPQAAEDTGRRLIWMNTVCALFLAGGVLGIAHPPGLVLQRFTADEVSPPVEIREFKQEPQQQPEAAAEDDSPPDEPAPSEPVSVPAVVVAPADANVAFAVEVKGPVIISKDPNFAVPPPRETRRSSASTAPAGPRRFERGGAGTGEGRFTPEPQYPRDALLRRESGAGEYLVTIDATGGITEIKLLSSSGSSTLDSAFRQHVRRLWRFRPEDAGDWIIPFEYRLR
jgi:protein TonB